MHVGWGEFAVIAAAVVLGASAQGVVGFGASLIAVPVVAVVAPDALPTTMVVVTAPMTVSMLLHERGHLDRKGFAFIALGRIPGTVVGVLIVTIATEQFLSGLAGVITLVGVGATLLANHHDVTRPLAFAAGTISGFTGTAAAIDGPPLALLYQHERPETMRSTLAASFALASAMSLTGLLIGGVVRGWQLGLALALLPSLAVGLGVAALVRRRISAHSLRPAVLAFVTVAGVVALLHAVF